MAREGGGLAVLKQTLAEFEGDQCFRLAAALAYYTIFSLPPLLILLTLLAGAVTDPARVHGAFIDQVATLIGPEGARQIRTMIEEAQRAEGGGLLTSILGGIALLFGATGAFVQLQGALNAAWDVTPKQGGVKGFFLKRLFSFAMVLALGFLLLVSLAVSTVLARLGGSVTGFLPPGLSAYALLALNFALTLAVVTFLFGAIFKVVPDVDIAWADVRTGALVTAFLFMAGKFLIGFYLGRSDPGSAYGAAGSLALVLLWIYYSALILLLGAEFTQVWARRRGKPIRPSPGAVRVEQRRVEDPAPAD